MQLFSTLFGIIFCILALSACGGSAQSTPAASGGMPAAAVTTTTLTSKELPDSSVFVGMLKSRKSVNLHAQVPGRIVQIFVRSGDQVPVGAPLFQLDKNKQEAMVGDAAASIESAQAEEETARATLKSLEANKASKEASLDYANRQYVRYKQLNDEGAVSTENVDNWRNQLNVARADLDAVAAQIRAQHSVLAKDGKLLKQAKSMNAAQREELHYYTVRAPFAGQIGDVPVKIGDFVGTDTLLTSVDQTRPLELYVNVPTTESKQIRKGLVTQVLNDDGTVEQQGDIFFVGAQVDQRDQSVLLKANLENAKETLRSGQEVHVRIIWSHSPVVTVPVTAVTRFTGQDFVFVAETGKDGKLLAKQKAVKLAAIEGNEYRVVSGLKVGDQVVTSGTQSLSDGAPIKIGS